MMQKPQIGMWMYQNGGGTEIENKLSYQLQDRNINVIKNIDLKNAVAHNGSLYCHDINLNQLDLFFSYNAGNQTHHQTYIYKELNKSIPMINNFEAFDLTEDKFRTSHLLNQHSITCSDYLLCGSENILKIYDQFQAWGNQAILKPLHGWGGKDLIKINNRKELQNILQSNFFKENPTHYFERVIKNDFTDYRIDIVNNEFIACYGRKAAKDSWKTNVTAGGKVIPREANDEIVNIALQAAKACQLEIAGVDILYDIERQQYVVLEVNGIPAFATPQQEKSGLNFNTKKIDAIVQLIDEKVHEHRQNYYNNVIRREAENEY